MHSEGAESARFSSLARLIELLTSNTIGRAALIAASLMCGSLVAATPLAVHQTRYRIRPGEPVAMAADQESLDFLMRAKTRRVQMQGPGATGIVAAPNRAGDQILLAASLRTKPGTYKVQLTASGADGEERSVALDVQVDSLVTVPSTATRPPVVLLNGWEIGFTNTCTVATSSSETFGNLAQYLVSDGVPVVYLFDNCVEDAGQTLETLGNDLGTFLNSIQYDNGTQVPQIDLVAHSMGGLIARAYLAGLQTGATLSPPTTTLVRDMVLIAVPNFGSFVAGNYATAIPIGSQSAELIPASAFLWNLATWNQRIDDLHGVNAIAVIGNAGNWLASVSAASALTNASDGIVSLASASLGFVAQDDSVTRIVPYCHIDPSAYTNLNYGKFQCNAPGIANVTDQSQPTGQIVRSFLSGTSDWQSIGGTPSTDPYLSTIGGLFFSMVSGGNQYFSDLTAVDFGNTALLPGGDSGTIYYADFIQGTGDFEVTSQSAGKVDCGTLTEALGYFSAARCKIATLIFDVTPFANAPGRVVASGAPITISGMQFGAQQCQGCQVYVIPAGSTSKTTLQISSWSDTSITANLPSTFTGLITLVVQTAAGTDSITVFTVAASSISTSTIALSPASLEFAYTAGGAAPASQSVQLSNSGSGTLAWTATANDSWLSVTPGSGTAPSTLTIAVSPSGLSVGAYTGSIQITSSGSSNTPQSIAVTLTITGAPATLAVSPQTLTFNYTFGSDLPSPQNVSITNAGSGTLNWTASDSDFWIALSPASGAAPGTLAVSVNPANLSAGTYTSNLQITAAGASGSPATVVIMLIVAGTQPAGVITGVTNGASFQLGFASATWITIFGTDLSQSTQIWKAANFVNGMLPTSLDGVSVTIDGIPAYVEYISPTQINALAPDDAKLGSVEVQVTAAQQTSNSFTAQKQQYSPAFFAINSYVAAVHSASGTIVGKAGLIPGVTTQPAVPGEVVELYATGFGPTNPPVPTSGLVTTPEPLPANSVQVMIGGVAAQVGFAGLTEAGLYQLNVTVPNLPDGDASVVAQIGGVQTQAGVLITIQQ